MSVVTVGVSKIMLHVADQWVEPVDNVESPVRTELNVCRAEVSVRGKKNRLDFFALETGAGILHRVLEHALKTDAVI